MLKLSWPPCQRLINELENNSMEVILVIHLFLALAIIGLVLLQRSEGGGLGIGGGGGGMGGLATPQGAANLLTKATGICAAAFFCTSLILGILAGKSSQTNSTLMDALDDAPAAIETPVETSEEPPEVPIAK